MISTSFETHEDQVQSDVDEYQEIQDIFHDDYVWALYCEQEFVIINNSPLDLSFSSSPWIHLHDMINEYVTLVIPLSMIQILILPVLIIVRNGGILIFD